jgi:thiamine pyrophosphokinase
MKWSFVSYDGVTRQSLKQGHDITKRNQDSHVRKNNISTTTNKTKTDGIGYPLKRLNLTYRSLLMVSFKAIEKIIDSKIITIYLE